MSEQGYVYMMANKHNTTLYIGVTNDLKRRVAEHKLHINKGFTDRYNIEKLVYFEICKDMTTAISREKQLKNWKREWKDALVNEMNHEWRDLVSDIGVDDEYMLSVKEYYDSRAFEEVLAKGVGDCGSSPQ